MVTSECGKAHEDLLRRFDYKPGYRVDARFDPIVNEVLLQVSYMAPDSDQPDDPTLHKIGRSRVFPLMCYDLWTKGSPTWVAFALGWVVQELGDMELHERDEWARVDGVRLHQPSHNARGLTP